VAYSTFFKRWTAVHAVCYGLAHCARGGLAGQVVDEVIGCHARGLQETCIPGFAIGQGEAIERPRLPPRPGGLGGEFLYGCCRRANIRVKKATVRSILSLNQRV
jgi:hypothetical protein